MKVLSLYKIENIEAKGEFAHHEQFILLPQCFQKPSASGKGLTKQLIVRQNYVKP